MNLKKPLSSHLILFILPSVIFHLLDHLELIVMGGSFLFELLLFFTLLYLLFSLHLFLMSENLQLFLKLSIEILQIYFFMSIDFLVVFGYLQIMIDFNLLLRFGMSCLGLLVTTVIWTFNVRSFWLIDFLEHSSSFLCLFESIFIPNHPFTVSRLVFLFLHKDYANWWYNFQIVYKLWLD